MYNIACFGCIAIAIQLLRSWGPHPLSSYTQPAAVAPPLTQPVLAPPTNGCGLYKRDTIIRTLTP